MGSNHNFNLNLISKGGGLLSSTNINSNSSSISSSSSSTSKGVFLPKNLFTPSSYYSYQSPYRSSQQRGGFDYRRLPPDVDWCLLFNLGVFTIFICSIFYICLYRYRNKAKIRRENEIKQKKLVYEFNQALKENERKQAVKRYNQILENKRLANSGLDAIRMNLDNPYLLNQNNNPYNNQNFNQFSAFNQSNEIPNNFNFNETSINQSSNKNKNDKNSYDLVRQSYKVDSYEPVVIGTPYNNPTTFMNW